MKVTLSLNDAATIEFGDLDSSFQVSYRGNADGSELVTVSTVWPDSAGRVGNLYEYLSTVDVDVDVDVERFPCRVYVSVRNWGCGFSHQVVAYGIEGDWMGYGELSSVTTDNGRFISFVDHERGSRVTIARVTDAPFFLIAPDSK